VASQLSMYGSKSGFRIVFTNWRNGLKFIENKFEVLQLSNTRLKCSCLVCSYPKMCYQIRFEDEGCNLNLARVLRF